MDAHQRLNFYIYIIIIIYAVIKLVPKPETNYIAEVWKIQCFYLRNCVLQTNVQKNGADDANIRRSTRPSKIKDYAKMVNDR